MFGFLNHIEQGNGRSAGGCRGGRGLAGAHCRRTTLLPRKWHYVPSLAEPKDGAGQDLDRVRALLAFDKRAQELLETLLAGYAFGNPPGGGARIAVLAGGLRARPCARSGPRPVPAVDGRRLRKLKGWDEYAPYVALRFFQHRQTELLLRPFVDEKSTRFPWKEVHDVYKLTAIARARARQPSGQPPALRERDGHDAGARVHPRAAAGHHERRPLCAARRALGVRGDPAMVASPWC